MKETWLCGAIPNADFYAITALHYSCIFSVLQIVFGLCSVYSTYCFRVNSDSYCDKFLINTFKEPKWVRVIINLDVTFPTKKICYVNCYSFVAYIAKSGRHLLIFILT